MCRKNDELQKAIVWFQQQSGYLWLISTITQRNLDVRLCGRQRSKRSENMCGGVCSGGSIFVFVRPIFSIWTTTFAFRHRSWFFQSVYILRCCGAVCISSSVLVVSLKTVFDIFMAFGVCAIVSSECVGCDSDELARTLLHLHRTAPCLPPTSADLGKMPPVQLKNMPPLTHSASYYDYSCTHPLMMMSREV